MRTMYDRVEECRTRLRSGLGLSCDASASGGCSGRGEECECSVRMQKEQTLTILHFCPQYSILNARY